LVRTLLTGATSEPSEFIKAGIVMRTITLGKSGIPTEDMPFSAFEPLELVAESWEDSGLSENLETRFLLVVFQENQNKGDLILRTAGFWTMPYLDRMAAREVWETTIEKFSTGDYASLPKMTSSPMVFVRTHGKNKEDKVLTPRGDYTERRSFWLGRRYLAEEIATSLTW